MKNLISKDFFTYTVKIWFLLLFIFTYVFIFCVNTEAFTEFKVNKNLDYSLKCDNTGVYLIGYSKNNINIGYVSENGIDERTVNIISDIKYVTLYEGNIYAVSVYNGDIIFTQYEYNTDSIYNYNFGKITINPEYKFCVSNGKIYFAENDIGNYFSCYDIYGNKQYSFNTNDITDYFNYDTDKIYFVSYDNIYMLNSNDDCQPEAVLGTSSLRPNIFISDNVISDYDGNLLNVTNDTILSTNINNNYINCAYSDGYCCKYDNGNIYGFDNDNNKYNLYKTGLSGNAQMCGYEDNIYLLYNSGTLKIVSKDELNYPQIDSTENSTTNKNDNTNSNHNNSHKNNTTDNNFQGSDLKGEFSINNYYVDEDKNIIWDIPQGTTIAKIKDNIIYNGYSLEFYNKDNIRKTSGKVGTGFYMIVKNGENECFRYSLSVKGDLTGEGSVNRNDVRVLSNYLTETEDISDIQYISADVNYDGILNGIDILKIAKNNL